jgi:transposase
MPAPELKSVVNVHTYANGHAAITTAGENGTLTLEIYPDLDESLISIKTRSDRGGSKQSSHCKPTATCGASALEVK